MTDSRPEKRENPSVPNNWVELKEYVEVRFAELVRHYDYRLDSLEKMRSVEYEDVHKRLEDVTKVADRFASDIRLLREGLVADEAQHGRYTTKEEVAQMNERISADIRILREGRATQEGRASIGSFYVVLVIALLGLGISLFDAIWK